MAKGASSKEIIFSKMLEVFEGAFMADAKTLRIPMTEDGEVIEVKVTLTCAKDILGAAVAPQVSGNTEIPISTTPAITAPTPEELDNVKSLLSALTF